MSTRGNVKQNYKHGIFPQACNLNIKISSKLICILKMKNLLSISSKIFDLTLTLTLSLLFFDYGNILGDVLINSISFASVSRTFKFNFLNSYSILSSLFSYKSSLSLTGTSTFIFSAWVGSEVVCSTPGLLITPASTSPLTHVLSVDDDPSSRLL